MGGPAGPDGAHRRGILLLNSSLRTPSLLGAGGALVVTSWLNVWVMYALQYAHLEQAAPGFRFAGDQELGGVERTFSDYLYVSLAVQATFGTGDVGVETVAMRKAVIPHVLITFAFNSVILAMLVSLVLGGI